MEHPKILGVLCAGIVFVSCSVPKMKVDLVLTDGDICTLDPRIPDAQAVAVTAGRIVAVGSKSEIASRFTGENEIDLHGAFVLPGLTDGHGHMSELGFGLTTLDLRDSKSSEEVASLVQAAVKSSPAGGWIRGRGWNQENWDVKAFPNHDVLDKAAPDNYVFLVRVDGHAIWVNKNVMELSGITRATKDPRGWENHKRQKWKPNRDIP